MSWCALHLHVVPLIRFYVEPFIYSLLIYVDLGDWFLIHFLALTKESLTRIKETQNSGTFTNSHTVRRKWLLLPFQWLLSETGRRRDPVAAKYLNYWTIAQVTVAAFYSLYPLLTDSTEPQSLWTLQALNRRHGFFPPCFMFLPRFILR